MIEATIKVILADDHQIVLDGLKEVLSLNEGIEVIATFNNGKEVVEAIGQQSVAPDVVVLDINMPEMDGLSCAKWIKQQHKNFKIIILTMYGQKSFTDEIIRIGIEGCLLKNHSGKELAEAIRRVHDGRSYFDHIKEFNENTDEIISFKLGAREIEIIKLLAKGYTTIQIADMLHISEFTVSTHRKNILNKTGASNTGQLIQFAINNQLI
jgi:DNA-binding NarL/FixJ family response regulator